MRKLVFTAAILVTLLIIPQISHCFDGQRKGFLFEAGAGVGVGGGTREYISEVGYIDEESYVVLPVTVDLRVAYSFDNRFSVGLYYSAGYWEVDNSEGKKVSMLASETLLYTRIFFQTEAPSYYIGAGVGAIGFTSLSSYEKPFSTGFVCYAELGKEISEHFLIDLEIRAGGPGVEDEDEEHSIFMNGTYTSFLITASYSWY